MLNLKLNDKNELDCSQQCSRGWNTGTPPLWSRTIPSSIFRLNIFQQKIISIIAFWSTFWPIVVLFLTYWEDLEDTCHMLCCLLTGTPRPHYKTAQAGLKMARRLMRRFLGCALWCCIVLLLPREEDDAATPTPNSLLVKFSPLNCAYNA